MKTPFHSRALYTAICLAVLSVFAPSAQAAPPDLTAAGVIAALKTDPNSTPVYGQTYNLGATGLRGWIYIGGGNPYDGTLTVDSRQILVTVASTPGSAVLAVDDVILGVMAGSSGTVPSFTSDCRKAFGVAIGDAEKTGAGTLRVKRWRAGTTTDVNIAMAIMGNYTNTAPYSCPKSALILANARNKLVAQLLADSNFLTADYAGAVNGLALLAGVAPGDPDYAAVQTRLQTFARALAATTPNPSGLYTWNWGYIGVFLSEYYLRTVGDGAPDAQVVTGLNSYAVALAKAQSRYGTYGHGGSVLKADGSLHGTIPPYGPVNSAGIPANIAIVMGKKALLAAGQAIDPEIDPAIQRGSDFFGWYVNKGCIPYGEHEPGSYTHSVGGKDQMCAVLFGLQADRTVEAEYFSRFSIASFDGREFAHAGSQTFSFLWHAMGAHMGGELALAEYTKQIRWHLDMVRRTDGSFAHEGQEQYGAGSTADGTYLGTSNGYGFQTTASYLLTYSLPLKRLYITGRNAIPANTLDAAKVANAIAAATYNRDVSTYTTTQLIAGLSEFDPVVRYAAAAELGKRSLTAGELTTLRGMLSGTDANGRMGACETLGRLNDATALPLITQRLDKTIETHSWVRAKAASALRRYPAASLSTQLTPMLTAFVANATDPEVIVWDDPIQFANGYVSYALFGGGFDGSATSVPSYTINASKNLLYPAVKVGLKQPDSLPRHGVADFAYNFLTLPDVNALIPDIIRVAESASQANTMFSGGPRAQGINTLAKWKISEGIPVALAMLDVPDGFGWNSSGFQVPALNALVAYGDASRWTLPALRGYIGDIMVPQTELLSTIASIENAITAPTLIPGLAVASNQVVTTTGAKAITLTGTSPRSAVTFTNVTAPSHGTLTGTPPNLTYTPTGGYTGPDHFTFQTVDNLTTSGPGTVSIIVGTAGTGLKGEYYDNPNFSNLKLTRTDAQVNFDWGNGSPNAALGANTFSVRWSGLLLVPETGSYTFSTLNSDGVRLYINGVPVIDQFANQEINWNDGASVNLTEGQLVEVQMDYFENTGSAVAKLKWTGPSFAGVNGAIIGSQWLFDGTGMTPTPYAFAQSLTLLKNTSKAITLTASAGSMTYSVVTPPAHGTLSGAAPNLTYTPVANYIGPDSFTFKVNNGTSDSAPATVSINAAPPVVSDESFSGYTPGALLSAESPAPTVAGYTGNWSGGASQQTFAGSLAYGGAVYTPGTGNHIGVLANASGVAWWLGGGEMTRQLDSSLTVTSATVGTRYMSFLFQSSTYAQYQMLLLNQGGNRTFGAGLSYNDGDGSTYDYQGPDTIGHSIAAATTTVNLFVVKFELSADADSDTFTVWLNPTLGGPGDPAGGMTQTGKNLTFDNLRIADYGADPAKWDEIRWGNTFNDVVNPSAGTPYSTTTTVVSSGSPSTYGNSVTFTATVSPIPSGGTVQFYSGFDYVGTPVAVNTTTGEATVSTTTLGATTHGITADYSGNYQFAASSTAASISQVVNKAPLTVTAQNEFRLQNTANPTLTAQITGFQNGENLGSPGVTGTPALSTTALLSSLVGDYPITCAVGDLTADNYDFATVGGTLTVVNPVEPFSGYTVGTLLSAESPAPTVAGYTGNWSGGQSQTTYAGSLAYGDVIYAAGTGDHVEAAANAPGVAWYLGGGEMTRNLDSFLAVTPTTTGTRYLSWLFKSSTYAQYQMLLLNQGGNRTFGAGLSYNDGDGSTYDYQGPDTIGHNTGVTATTAVNLFVVKFELSATTGQDQVTVWLNPMLGGSGDPAGGMVLSGTDLTFDRLVIADYGADPVAWDEIRWGTTFNDVVNPSAGTPYSTWATTNGATGQTPDQDHDNDGVENGIEYFMGETGSSFTTMPGLNSSNTITWPASAAYQGTYEVQTSPDLATWVPVDPQPTASGGNLSYTLPPGAPSGKSFVRLLVTPTP